MKPRERKYMNRKKNTDTPFMPYSEWLEKNGFERKIKQKIDESMSNLMLHGQSCAHLPSMTVGVTLEDVLQKMRQKI